MIKDIGDYKISHEIGKGSFGKVYKGVHKLTNQQVALKFIEKKQKRPRDIKNLRQENELLKKIKHENVIELKDVIQTAKQIIIVTDYAGRDLSGVIQQKKKFPLDKVKDYSRQILSAMLYLNENRIIHRDLKPQNILIKDNHIKLCDFGFAKKLSASTNFLQSMKGTPLYLAPEIVRETKYTEKVDVWSFGCIIYQLYTGRTPYYANTYQKLAPLILYQQVQYPKQMPADLKDLITSMLQKNPAARPNWKQLKQHTFFQSIQPLQQKKVSNIIPQIQIIQAHNRQAIVQGHGISQNAQQVVQIQESKVLQRLDNQQQIHNYFCDFKKILQGLNSGKVQCRQIRYDIILLHKIKQIFHQRIQPNNLIQNQLLQTVFNILNFLIKNKKFNQNQKVIEGQSQDDDITQNQTLIIAILCLAKVQANYQMLQKQLRIICLLIKRNFNGIQINTEIDQQITQFVTEILLENSSKLPLQCIRNGLIIIGTLANQAMMTITKSFSYFQKIAEDKLLSKILNIYKKQQRNSVILQCIKQFIHPIRDVPMMNTSNPNHLLDAKNQFVFKNLKQQVAQSLLKTDFISQNNPLEIFSDKNSINDYCEILLQCLMVSIDARKQFLKYNYWTKFLQNRKTKVFLFAYNSIFLTLQNVTIIPKQSMLNFTKQSQQNKLINIFIIQMGYYNLKKKTSKLTNTPNNNSNIAVYQKSILQKINQFLFFQQDIKQKCCREIYGTLQSTTKRFNQVLIQIFSEILSNCNTSEQQTNNQLYQHIFKRICSTNTLFKPNSKSLFKMIKLFVQNQILRPIKAEKSVQNYFYEVLTDFIKVQEYQFLQYDFAQEFIPVFLSKFMHCANYLIDIQQNKSNSSNLSQSALSFSKYVQSSSFYRFMFIDNLKQDQFYQHLKYTNKVLTKSKQIDPQFMNYLGVRVVAFCKNFISSKNQNILIQIFLFISHIARDHPQFNNQVFNTKIIKRFRQWLIQPIFSQQIKEKVLYLIGNLAKRSQYFFAQFQTQSVIQAIGSCLQQNQNQMKIFKNTIYSIGNISYYSQKFHKQISPMIMIFSKTFELPDNHLKNNLISTISNLLRFSNIYLVTLIKSGMIEHILRIASQTKQNDQTFTLALSVIKKIIPYHQFYQAFGLKDLQIIYQKRHLVAGDTNQTMRKIKEVLTKANKI